MHSTSKPCPIGGLARLGGAYEGGGGLKGGRRGQRRVVEVEQEVKEEKKRGESGLL